MTCSTPILWQECQSRPTPTNSAALLLCILFHARTLLPRIPTPSVSIIHFLSSSSSQSIHLVGASQRGLGLLCARHTWAVASVWKWGSFAFKHSALWALGKLDERRMKGGGWRGEMERTRGSGEREKERERARGVIATLRVQDREELKGGGGV